MRAPFDDFVTMYDGPGTATPGFPRVVDDPCRLVNDPYFVDLATPMGLAVAYFTVENDVPRGPTTTMTAPGVWTFDFTKADEVEFASFPGTLFKVVRVESCTGPDQAEYWRAQIELKVPPLTECQDGYAESYEIYDDNDMATHIVIRTSSTTWEGEGYVLTAEVEWVNPDICLSKWTIVFAGNEFINVNWDGVASGIFYDYVGPLSYMLVNPV